MEKCDDNLLRIDALDDRDDASPTGKKTLRFNIEPASPSNATPTKRQPTIPSPGPNSQRGPISAANAPRASPRARIPLAPQVTLPHSKRLPLVTHISRMFPGKQGFQSDVLVRSTLRKKRFD
eukprot:1016906-Pyramimonas_sp.AAC.2